MNRSRRNLTAFTANLSAMTLWSLAGINYLIYSCLQDAYAFWRAASAKEKGKLDTRREINSAWIRPGGYERREPTRTHRWGERFEGVIDDKDDVYTAQFALCPPSSAVSAIFLFLTTRQTSTAAAIATHFFQRATSTLTSTNSHPPTVFTDIYVDICVYMRTWICYHVEYAARFTPDLGLDASRAVPNCHESSSCAQREYRCETSGRERQEQPWRSTGPAVSSRARYIGRHLGEIHLFFLVALLH